MILHVRVADKLYEYTGDSDSIEWLWRRLRKDKEDIQIIPEEGEIVSEGYYGEPRTELERPQ